MSRSVSPNNLANLDISPERIIRDAEYAAGVVRAYRDWSHHTGDRVEGKRVLELGPGLNFAGALGLLGIGAKSAMVADRWLSPWRDAYHRPLYHRVSEILEGEGSSSAAGIFADASSRGHGSLVGELELPIEELPTSGATFDMIFSNAVLEHLFDHERGIHSLASITERGGWNLHQIDYRDHADISRPLEHLLMTPAEFDALDLDEPCSRGCQVRMKEHCELFARAGFSHVYTYLAPAPDPAYLNEFEPRLRRSNSRYRDWHVDDYSPLGAMMIFRKQ